MATKTTIQLTENEVIIKQQDRAEVRLVWDEHMKTWAPCISKN